LKWIKDYLASRQQKVIVRNEESERCDAIVVSLRVQSWSLICLLSMLMIYLRHLRVNFFADDTKLLQSVTCDLDIVQLQADTDNFLNSL